MTGIDADASRIRSSETPASSGVAGPGDITIASGGSESTASTVIASLRTTATSAPSAPNSCTRLNVKLS